MFASKKKPAQQQSSADNFLKKMEQLPPLVHLFSAATLAAYALFAIFIDNARFVGLCCIAIALMFAVMGVFAQLREMRSYKVIASNSNKEKLQAMTAAEFERYLVALFSLDGYKVRTAAGELNRMDDADLIAVKKKQILLIQYNHWFESTLHVKHLQSLQKAASAIGATECFVISFGTYSQDTKSWAERKGVAIKTAEDILAMANKLTGSAGDSAEENEVQPTETEPNQSHDFATPRTAPPPARQYLFFDFGGIEHDLSLLDAVLEEVPQFLIFASTLPEDKNIDSIRMSMPRSGHFLIGSTPEHTDGRYYAIQNFLMTTPEGKHAPWVAVDSDPRQFPEGTIELIVVNRSFGFDRHSASTLHNTLMRSTR